MILNIYHFMAFIAIFVIIYLIVRLYNKNAIKKDNILGERLSEILLIIISLTFLAIFVPVVYLVTIDEIYVTKGDVYIKHIEVDEFSLEEDNITIHNKNGFKILISRETKESVLYFYSDQVDDVEILGVEDILKFSSEINSGKKTIEQRFWLDDDNLIARVENNVKDVKVTKSEKDNDNSDDGDSGSEANDLMLSTVICTLLNWKDDRWIQ